MSIEQILEILKTREKAAVLNGNTTELCFVKELMLIVDEYIRLKEQNDKR